MRVDEIILVSGAFICPSPHTRVSGHSGSDELLFVCLFVSSDLQTNGGGAVNTTIESNAAPGIFVFPPVDHKILLIYL